MEKWLTPNQWEKKNGKLSGSALLHVLRRILTEDEPQWESTTVSKLNIINPKDIVLCLVATGYGIPDDNELVIILEEE